MIWPDDHTPPHIHVVRGDRVVAVVNLAVDGHPISIRVNYGMKRQEMAFALAVVGENNDLFTREWVKIHGKW